PHGSPTEAALLSLALKADLDWQTIRQQTELLDRIPFSSEQKYMITLHQQPGEGRVIYAKGAPEVIFTMSEQTDQEYWQRQSEQLATQGYRVLAVAVKYDNLSLKELDTKEAVKGYQLLGLFGLI